MSGWQKCYCHDSGRLIGVIWCENGKWWAESAYGDLLGWNHTAAGSRLVLQMFFGQRRKSA